VSGALDRVREYGLAIVVEDLGDWDRDELRSEYDPHGPTIRINARVLRALATGARAEFIERAVAHELYHHRERIGEVERLTDRTARERAADAFAAQLTGSM
jgi:hypothetical protein